MLHVIILFVVFSNDVFPFTKSHLLLTAYMIATGNNNEEVGLTWSGRFGRLILMGQLGKPIHRFATRVPR